MIDIWESPSITFTLPTQDPSCGDFTYSLKSTADDSVIGDAAFGLTEGVLAIDGSATDLSFEGSKSYYIEASNLSGFTSRTVDFTIEFVNSCLSTEIQDQTINTMYASVKSGETTEKIFNVF